MSKRISSNVTESKTLEPTRLGRAGLGLIALSAVLAGCTVAPEVARHRDPQEEADDPKDNDPNINVEDIDPTDPKPTPTPVDACVKGSLELKAEIPTVLLLIDQSGSMTEPFDGGNRWDVLRDALTDPNSGVVRNLQDKVRFGIALYSSDGGSGPDRACPMIETPDSTTMGLNSYDAIRAFYLDARPAKDTPTAESVAAAREMLLAYEAEGPKAILLATDGNPDTCADPDAHNQASQDFAVETVTKTHEAGISTYVLSVGDEVAQDHLQNMANAGIGAADGATSPYWKATDQAALKSALETIINGVRSCSFALEGDVDTALVKSGTVKLDGETLTYGVDWTLNGKNEVELEGGRCDALKTGTHNLQAEFPCLKDGKPVVVR